MGRGLLKPVGAARESRPFPRASWFKLKLSPYGIIDVPKSMCNQCKVAGPEEAAARRKIAAEGGSVSNVFIPSRFQSLFLLNVCVYRQNNTWDSGPS